MYYVVSDYMHTKGTGIRVYVVSDYMHTKGCRNLTNTFLFIGFATNLPVYTVEEV